MRIWNVGARRAWMLSIVVATGFAVAAISCDRNGGETPDPPESPDVSDRGGPNCGEASVPDLDAVDVAPDDSFRNPVYVTQAPEDSQTLYVVERPGRIVRVRDGEVLDTPFLDIRDRVATWFGERGLLGLAFHPDYPSNGRFFVHYTPANEHRVVVAEYRRADGKDVASNEEVQRLVSVRDPERNHNGGMVTFGPDGKLYASIGDGGGSGDQHGSIGNAQNIDNVFGSIVRLAPDAGDRDFAPSDNPFADTDSGNDKIWHFGLRNAWRFSFDSKTGDLYIGDVGQNDYEELDVLPGGHSGGVNFGWRAYEGNSVFDSDLADQIESHREPLIDYPLKTSDAKIRGGCSIIGGYVYRGDAISDLRGTYLYGDNCSADVVALRWCQDGTALHSRAPGLQGEGNGLASFGEGLDGELYLVYVGSGDVKRIVAR